MARTLEPAKEPRINFPVSAKLRDALNKKSKKEGRLREAVLTDLVAEYVAAPVKKAR